MLSQFGTTRGRARREYVRFVAAGVQQGRRVELPGGGVIRSAGGWQVVQELRRGQEWYAGDERILGSREFVERVRQDMSGRLVPSPTRLRSLSVERGVERVCQAIGVRAEELQGGGRRAVVSRARAGIAYLWLEWLGRSGPTIARAVGVHPATIYEVARRGRREATYWEQLGVDFKPSFPCNVPETKTVNGNDMLIPIHWGPPSRNSSCGSPYSTKRTSDGPSA